VSDAPGGPDWYQASDGKWYPSQPAQAPYGGAPATPPPPGGVQPSGGYQAPAANPYGQPPTGQMPTQAPSNGMATTAMVLGIVALVTFWFCGLGSLLGVIAIVLGALGMSAAKKLPGEPLIGRAKAGLIMGIVSVVLSVIFLIGWLVLINVGSDNDLEINSDPSNGICDESRFLQDPDC
jgi:predicted small integral membrane protein